jgi:hypothetical protein
LPNRLVNVCDSVFDVRKAFLKAPLKFTRISSGYSLHRLHPVHGTVRAHTGVDYAAPTGTPVMSIREENKPALDSLCRKYRAAL